MVNKPYQEITGKWHGVVSRLPVEQLTKKRIFRMPSLTLYLGARHLHMLGGMVSLPEVPPERLTDSPETRTAPLTQCGR